MGGKKKKATVPSNEIEPHPTLRELEDQIGALTQSRAKVEAVLRQYTDLYDFAPAGYFTLGRDGVIHQANQIGMHLLGLEEGGAIRDRLESFVSAEFQIVFKTFFEKLLSGEGHEVGEIQYTRNGKEALWARTEGTCFEGGGETRIMLTDITKRKRMEFMLQARQRLSEFAGSLALEEFLQRTIDEIETLTDSEIGFFHFMDPDQKTLSLQMWSHNTMLKMCTAESTAMHYAVEKAGVWVDCVHTRGAVIYNDYPSLPQRKGLPAGHAPIQRILVVPVLRDGLIVAILGVGNKAGEYDQHDTELVLQLADSAWDIVQRKRVEDRLKKNQSMLNEMGRMANVGAWEFDIDTQVQNWTEEVYRIHELDADFDPTVDTGVQFYPTSSRPILEKALQRARDFGESFSLELEFVTARGNLCWVHVIGNADLKNRRIFGTFQDISERKQAQQALQESEERYRTVVSNSPMVTFVLNEEGRFTLSEGQGLAKLGLLPGQMVGSSALDVYRDYPEVLLGIRNALEGHNFRQEVTVNGVVFDAYYSPVQDEHGKVIKVIGVAHDITDRKLAEAELQYMKAGLEAANRDLQIALTREKQLTHTDFLTGVNSRGYLFELAEREINFARRHHSPLAVVMFDIDHFKRVNDTYGHLVGDQILERVAKIASLQLRSSDVIGRYGGEEFVAFLPMTGARHAYLLAERVRANVETLRTPTEKGEASVTLSIGVVELNQTLLSESVEDVIRRADQLMYAAKQAGRNCIMADLENLMPG